MNCSRQSQLRALALLALPFLVSCMPDDLAIELPGSISTSDCLATIVSQTATFSSNLAVKTGAQVVHAGDYWHQGGAIWEFSTDVKGFELGLGGVPGAGAGFGGSGIPAGIDDAFELSDDKSTIKFIVPMSQSSQYDFQFTISQSSLQPTQNAEQILARVETTSVEQRANSIGRRAPPGRTKTASEPTRLGRTTQKRAQYQKRDADSDSVNLIIRGVYPCSGTSATPTAKLYPDIASSCLGNLITAGPDSWKSYEVNQYISSIINSAAPSPTYHIDGVSLVASDANYPKCTYTADCDDPSCAAVRDANSGTLVSVQRFLAYKAIANLNDYLFAVYSALTNSAYIAGLVTDGLVKTFYTNPEPDASWDQMIGPISPLLGMASAMTGPFSAAGGAGFGIASGLIGAVGAMGTIDGLKPVTDKRFDEAANITDLIISYMRASTKGLELAYSNTIGSGASEVIWIGSPVAPDGLKSGLFGDGVFASEKYTEGLAENLPNNMVRIFLWKAINYAWIESGAFIVYVPYHATLKGPNGKMIKNGIDADWCKNQLKHKKLVGKTVNCDTHDGMAILVSAAGGDWSGELSSPQGYDATYPITPSETFSVMDAIAGSVASWQAGDFNYDASDPYSSAFGTDGGFSYSQVQAISKLEIKASTAGFFNIPVCQTWDLRFFPAAGSTIGGLNCLACDTAVSVGGTPHSQKRFKDNVRDIIKDTLKAQQSDGTCPPDSDAFDG